MQVTIGEPCEISERMFVPSIHAVMIAPLDGRVFAQNIKLYARNNVKYLLNTMKACVKVLLLNIKRKHSLHCCKIKKNMTSEDEPHLRVKNKSARLIEPRDAINSGINKSSPMRAVDASNVNVCIALVQPVNKTRHPVQRQRLNVINVLLNHRLHVMTPVQAKTLLTPYQINMCSPSIKQGGVTPLPLP